MPSMSMPPISIAPLPLLTWSLAGGADQAKFTIDASTGVLSFSSSPDYENPTDVGPDNVYEVQVTVSDGSDSSSPQMISITISDVVEAQPPVITQGTSLSTKTGNEDTTFTWTAAELNATDADTSSGSLTWSVDTNATNGVATVSGTGSSPATFSYVPDGNYSGGDSFVVQVSDGALTDTVTVTVTVNAVNDAPAITQGSSLSTKTGNEDTTFTWTTAELNATDADTSSGSLTWSVDTNATNGVATVSGTDRVPRPFPMSPTVIIVVATVRGAGIGWCSRRYCNGNCNG